MATTHAKYAVRSTHNHSPTHDTVHACGKFILTGEHAVVHGRRAIACPLHTYAMHAGVADLRDTRWYDALHPLIRHSMTQIGLDDYFACNPGKQLYIDGNLPVGIGLGASAALITALIRLDESLNARPRCFEDALELGRVCEDYVHGRSSGIDVAVALCQAPIRYSAGEGMQLHNHDPAPDFALVNTGAPTSSTGECVALVSEHFPGDAPIWDAFAEVCADILDNGVGLDAIRRNHALLCDIGVVPPRVAAFIDAIERAGGAAKISGAGNIHTDTGAAGTVIVTGIGHKELGNICHAHGYSLFAGQY